MRLPPSGRLLPSLLAAIFAFVLSGCGGTQTATSNPSSPSPVTTFSGSSFSGRVLAGKTPIAGASVQLYAAGLSGNGSSGTPLLATAVSTDTTGSFQIPAGYACPSSSSLLYLIATGGSAGTPAPNTAIKLLTALGTCNQITSSTQVTINELTTVAAAYALSQFLSPGGSLGATATNTSGLQNAFSTAAALANPVTGTSPGPTFSPNGSSPAPLLNTAANVLDTCVTNPTTCSTLFSSTTPASTGLAQNTLDAALDLARNPVASPTALFSIASANPVFAPALVSAPSDWTLYIDYTGGGMNNPTGLGLDSAGNVWVANYFNVASLFSPLGKPLFANGITGLGLSASYGLAVDGSGNAWIPNQPNAPQPGNSVTVLNSNGASVPGSAGYTSGGINYPTAVVIDTDGSAWVLDYGNSHLTHLSSSGQPLSGIAGYSSPQMTFPVAAALDSSHSLWVANQGAATVTKVSPDGSQFTSYTCCSAPSAMAVDRQGDIWITNYYGNTVSEISPSGKVLSDGYIGGGLNAPQGIAIDGAGNLWIANYHGSSVTEFAGASASTPGAPLSPAAGFGAHAALRESYAIAIDASGNLWVTNFGSNTLTEFVGVAVPVRTPLIGPPVLP